MGPVLALELSTEGIFLHELSYDGKWRQISAASLSDPYLPKKMAAMRAAARASQGRLFKNEVWVPRDQMILTQMELASDDEQMRTIEAGQKAADDPEIPAGDYIVRVGDETKSGEYTVALLDKGIVAEAVRFAGGYNFGTDGITVPGRVSGFFQKPYFDTPTIAKPVIVNVRRIVNTLAAGGLAAGVAYGGWWIYNSIEFSPNPATVIEAAENQNYSEQEDPRAPIRPTATTVVSSQLTPELTQSQSAQNAITNLDRDIDAFPTYVGTTSLASSLFMDAEPTPASPLDQISFWQESPLQAEESRPDSLPAPESGGFPTVAVSLTAPANVALTPNLSLDLADAEYISKRPANEFSATPDLTDRLPSEESTVVLAALERKLNDSFGLTQVRENDADVIRLSRVADFQNVEPIVVSGLPDFTPVLRSGADITDIIEVPEVVVAAAEPQSDFLSILQLQTLPPIVETGLPDIVPPLRGGVEIGAEPVVEAPPAEPLTIAELQALEPEIVSGSPPFIPVLRPETLAAVDETPNDTPTAEDPVTETDLAALTPAPELSLDELQNLAADVIQGAPEVLPILRSGDDVDAITVSTSNLPELSLEELQNLAANVEEGRPDIVPVLREGTDIDAVIVPEPVDPDLSIEELQNLAANITEGAPDIVPPLRESVEVAAVDPVTEEPPEVTEPVTPPRELTLDELQNLAAVVEQGRPPVLPVLRSGEPVNTVVLTPEAQALQIAALQAEEPLVLEGRPPVIPVLREQIDLGEGSGVIAPDIATGTDDEAARYRPIFRPASIAEISRLNDPDLSEAAVVTATAPPRRSPEFANKVASMVQAISEAPIVTEPRFTDTPREVSLPTSASVAAAATLEDAINLRATNLIGVYGTPGSYRALVRLNGGRYITVTIGESIGGGWSVVGMDESTIRVQKGSRTETLGLPG